MTAPHVQDLSDRWLAQTLRVGELQGALSSLLVAAEQGDVTPALLERTRQILGGVPDHRGQPDRGGS